MKIYINILFSYLFCIYLINPALAASYSKTNAEKRAEAMGSITDGIIFRPKIITNNSTKTTESRINKYLWQAAIDVIKFTPIASADSESGVILTDWYSPKGQNGYGFKINIFIKGQVISPNAFEVRVFQQKMQNGKLIAVADSSSLANTLESKILHKARDLYINSQKKK